MNFKRFVTYMVAISVIALGVWACSDYAGRNSQPEPHVRNVPVSVSQSVSDSVKSWIAINLWNYLSNLTPEQYSLFMDSVLIDSTGNVYSLYVKDLRGFLTSNEYYKFVAATQTGNNPAQNIGFTTASDQTFAINSVIGKNFQLSGTLSVSKACWEDKKNKGKGCKPKTDWVCCIGSGPVVITATP